MQIDKTLKKRLIDSLSGLLDKKIGDFASTIRSIEESKSNDTKSSAGDKYETGREMAQQELQNVQRQLIQNQNLKRQLERAGNEKESHSIKNGSLVATSGGIYFIAIPLGILKFDNTEFFCISPSSPMGQELLGKSAGQEISFRDQRITIEYVI